jgi:hypothetical protein
MLNVEQTELKPVFKNESKPFFLKIVMVPQHSV